MEATGSHRRIDLPPYPRGWFAVATSEELSPGDVKPLRYFGEELVLFRTASGEAVLFDAYCPHLGAHLGHGGSVDGDELVCPFHGWRYASDGACSGMPYGQRIPPAAQLRRWPLREQNGVILAWHAPDGADVQWEMQRFDDAQWTPCVSRRWEISGHPQEVTENTVDFGHFRFIHGSNLMRALGPPKIDGATFEVELESDPEALVEELRVEGPPLSGSGFCFGPGLTAATIVPKGSGLFAMQRLYVTPIDEERIGLLGVVNVGKLDDEQATGAFLESLAPEVFRQWENDVPIWEHKCYRARPALNETEAAVPIFRRWYAQFYA